MTPHIPLTLDKAGRFVLQVPLSVALRRPGSSRSAVATGTAKEYEGVKGLWYAMTHNIAMAKQRRVQG